MQIGIGKQATRVGFILNFSDGWLGGVNYYNNLFKNIYQYGNGELEIVVFTDEKTAEKLKKFHSNKITIVVDDIFNRKTIKWFWCRVFQKFFGLDFMLASVLNKHNVKILSHLDRKINIKNIIKLAWIPDFQHIHLPQYFSTKEIAGRDNNFSQLIRGSDGVILSSNDAKKDLEMFTKENKVESLAIKYVLNFSVDKLNEKDFYEFRILQEKFKIREEFIFLPNQFWVHKNHIVVVEALKILQDRGANYLIVSTGNTADPRDSSYFPRLEQLIKKYGLEEKFNILGQVNYKEVISLMYYSKAVINPSLFEGWSTTVEEAKMMNKIIILSNLAVHREQNPENGIYFNPSSAAQLADIIESVFKNSNEIVKKDYLEYQKKSAREYEKIIKDILKIKTNNI